MSTTEEMTDERVFTRREICVRNKMSESTLAKLDRLGLGPKYMRAFNFLRVTLEEERAWQAMLQNEEAREAARACAVARARHAGRLSAASPRHVSKQPYRPRKKRGA
jgi:hypothetical protein